MGMVSLGGWPGIGLFVGDVKLADNDELQVSDEGRIYSDGTDMLIEAQGATPDLKLLSGDNIIIDAEDEIRILGDAITLSLGTQYNYHALVVQGPTNNVPYIRGNNETGAEAWSIHNNAFGLNITSRLHAEYLRLAAEDTGGVEREVFRGDPDGDTTITSTQGDVVLTPNGNVKFGTHAAIAAETLTGYITIKDAGGTTRKLGVIS